MNHWTLLKVAAVTRGKIPYFALLQLSSILHRRQRRSGTTFSCQTRRARQFLKLLCTFPAFCGRQPATDALDDNHPINVLIAQNAIMSMISAHRRLRPGLESLRRAQDKTRRVERLRGLRHDLCHRISNVRRRRFRDASIDARGAAPSASYVQPEHSAGCKAGRCRSLSVSGYRSLICRYCTYYISYISYLPD
jgi:hypothetical protein